MAILVKVYSLGRVQVLMLGVRRIPQHYHQTLAEFKPAFYDDRNRPSFRQLTKELLVAESQWTIAALARGISHTGDADRQ